jgi:hypothetical protein
MEDSMDSRQVTCDDALLWLNDRVGRPAAVYVTVEQPGGYSQGVLTCERGVLEHWTADKPVSWPGHPAQMPRDDIAGAYYLASDGPVVRIDLTGIEGLLLRKHDWPEEMQQRSEQAGLGRAVDEELVLALGEDAEMQVLVYDPVS